MVIVDSIKEIYQFQSSERKKTMLLHELPENSYFSVLITTQVPTQKENGIYYLNGIDDWQLELLDWIINLNKPIRVILPLYADIYRLADMFQISSMMKMFIPFPQLNIKYRCNRNKLLFYYDNVSVRVIFRCYDSRVTFTSNNSLSFIADEDSNPLKMSFDKFGIKFGPLIVSWSLSSIIKRDTPYDIMTYFESEPYEKTFWKGGDDQDLQVEANPSLMIEANSSWD